MWIFRPPFSPISACTVPVFNKQLNIIQALPPGNVLVHICNFQSVFVHNKQPPAFGEGDAVPKYSISRTAYSDHQFFEMEFINASVSSISYHLRLHTEPIHIFPSTVQSTPTDSLVIGVAGLDSLENINDGKD